MIKTPRLLLRQPSMNDSGEYGSILSIANVTKYTDIPDDPTQKRSDRMVSWMSKLHEKQNGCAWIIENQADSEIIGAIRINQIFKKAKCGVIGYELHPDEWGQGKMTEALKAVVAVGHDVFALHRLEAWTLPGNIASDRVLEKSGFKYEGTMRHKEYFKQNFQDLNIFARIVTDP